MASKNYFDCFATYGPYPQKHPLARWRLSELVEDLNLAGISGALVQHTQQVLGDPMRANYTLAEELGKFSGRLFPCWIALPNTCGDFPDPHILLKEMQKHDVRAVRIEGDAFNLPSSEPVWGELRDALVAERIPVFLVADSFRRDYGSLEALMRLFQGTDMVLTGHNWAQWRTVESLLCAYPSLHMEFSGFQANRAVEYFSARYGAERFLFGTGLMQKAPGAARGFSTGLSARKRMCARCRAETCRGFLRKEEKLYPLRVPGKPRPDGFAPVRRMAIRYQKHLAAVIFDQAA